MRERERPEAAAIMKEYRRARCKHTTALNTITEHLTAALSYLFRLAFGTFIEHPEASKCPEVTLKLRGILVSVHVSNRLIKGMASSRPLCLFKTLEGTGQHLLLSLTLPGFHFLVKQPCLVWPWWWETQSRLRWKHQWGLPEDLIRLKSHWQQDSL